jgi:hypothetical protein
MTVRPRPPSCHRIADEKGVQYSYLLSPPLIATYALGFAVIKYRQGFIEYEGGGERRVLLSLHVSDARSDSETVYPLA